MTIDSLKVTRGITPDAQRGGTSKTPVAPPGEKPKETSRP